MGSDLPIDLHAIFSPEHYEAVGPALWLLVWAVSSQSEDGWVRGGIWLSRQTIANEIGCSVSSVKRHLGRLEPDYLTVERGHAGLRIRLKNRADLSRPRVNSDPTPGQS
jgi:biotin operon repressor